MITGVLLQVTSVPQVIQGNPGDAEMSLFELLAKGGWILTPILLISILSVYIMIAKYFEIRESVRIDEGMVNNFKNSLRRGELSQALAVLQGSNSAFGRIFYHATGSIGKPIREIESSIETASQIESNKMSRNLHYLGLFAGIAPMLGFVGTIAGVIKIFYNISLTDNISIGIISGGLYQKMISSGCGLIVGVIAYTGYHLLNIMVDKYLSRIESEAFDFINIIQSK